MLARIEDPKIKLVDRQKLKKLKVGDKIDVLIGALFHNILKPTVILCKCFQADEISFYALLRLSLELQLQ